MLNLYTTNKHLVNEEFRQILSQAWREALLWKLLGKSSRLLSYEEARQDKSAQRNYLGVVQIPTERVTGTVGRSGDFDGRFRPLKAHLRERWVNVAVRAQGAGWLPIEAIKVGDDYFVVDGHHRTSVARSAGIAFIDAKVWEIAQEPEASCMPPVAIPVKPVPVGVMSLPDPANCCLPVPSCVS